MSYDWPGNVRELKAVVDFAVIHSRSGWIEPGDLPPEVAQAATVDASRPGSEQGLEPIREGSDERARLLAALQRAGGNRTEAAKLLGVSRATFYRRLTQLGIEPGTT